MFVVTGATSRTSSIVADTLLYIGARVRVLGRSLKRLKRFVEKGAEAYVVELSDAFTALCASDFLQHNLESMRESMRKYDFQDWLNREVRNGTGSPKCVLATLGRLVG